MVELTQEHIKASIESNGTVKLDVINSEEFEQKVKEFGYPISISEIQNVMDCYTESLTLSSETTTEGAFATYANLDVGLGIVGGTIDTSGRSCGDALSIIALLHAGLYSTAANLLRFP
ncbi:hypothetical protein AB3U99_12725 [Niallia sp. JL1B1071]|uniref:hypothetical protein n=1 Tax=Niallia tiangongensis TaxID=3237105 RepID=UPI0037DD6C91